MPTVSRSESIRRNVEMVVEHMQNVHPEDIVNWSVEHNVESVYPRVRVEFLLREPLGERRSRAEMQRLEVERAEIIARMMAPPIIPQNLNINWGDVIENRSEDVSDEQEDENRFRRMGIR